VNNGQSGVSFISLPWTGNLKT